MKRFRFRLDAVGRVRSVVERQARAEFGAAIAALETTRGQRDAEQAAAASFSDEVDRAFAEASASAGELKRLLIERDLCFERAAMLSERLAECQREVDEKIEALADARRERRVVDRLRERAHEAWTLEATRRENEEQGELFLTRVARERANGESQP